METIIKKISAEFVEELNNAGITQQQVAQDLHMSKGNVSKIFSGARSMTLDNMSKLSIKYGISASTLIVKHMGLAVLIEP